MDESRHRADDPEDGGSPVGRAFLLGWRIGHGGIEFAHLWDNVALFAALVAIQASGWPWPTWRGEIIPSPFADDAS